MVTKRKGSKQSKLYRMAAQAASELLTQRMMAKPSTDVHRFVFELCNTRPGASVSAPQLHLRYGEWGGTLAPAEFEQAMLQRFFLKTINGEPRFIGVALAGEVGETPRKIALRQTAKRDAFDGLQRQCEKLTVDLQSNMRPAFRNLQQQFARRFRPKPNQHSALDKLRHKFAGMCIPTRRG